MNQPVLLKGNSLGLTMVLDPGMKFDQLIKAIEDKFVQAKDFFNGQTQIALKIEGRKLDAKELQNVLQIIAEKTTLSIAYVIEDDKIMETSFKDVLKKIQEREQKRLADLEKRTQQEQIAQQKRLQAEIERTIELTSQYKVGQQLEQVDVYQNAEYDLFISHASEDTEAGREHTLFINQPKNN